MRGRLGANVNDTQTRTTGLETHIDVSICHDRGHHGELTGKYTPLSLISVSIVSAHSSDAVSKTQCSTCAYRRGLTTQFVLCGIFDLQGLRSRDCSALEFILRCIPLGFVDLIRSTGAAERVADRHCGQAPRDETRQGESEARVSEGSCM
jgi:hypothetical protein